MGSTANILQIGLLVVLLLGSGFFSASETSLMSLSKIRIRYMEDEGVKGAKLVGSLIEKSSDLLSSILVGNNIVNIAATSVSTSLFINIFGDGGVVIATAVMTVLVLIFGEITPKSIAKQKSESVSLAVSKFINIVVKVLKPFIILFTGVASIFIRLLGGDPKANEPFITEEEIKTMVGVSEEEGVLEDVEKEMIFNVFDFADAQVKDVMVQRVDIIAVDLEASYDEVLDVIKKEQFSRIPVYNQTIDDIVGILNVKDLIMAEQDKEKFKVADYMREPNYTFEFKKIAELFKEMKKTRNHIAVVLDEYGGTVGIVTIEDLIEEVFGDIEDEYDDENKEIEVIKEDEYIVDGSAKLDVISELIGVNMESEEFDSVGGLLIGELGRFPEQNEEITLNNIKFTVEEIDKNRVKKVRIFT